MIDEEQWLNQYWRDQRAALPAEVLVRLRAARTQALESQRSTTRFRVPGWSLPLGVLAATVVLALGVWWVHPSNDLAVRATDNAVIEDAELLASTDDPGLYAEDPEFLEWSQAQTVQPVRK